MKRHRRATASLVLLPIAPKGASESRHVTIRGRRQSPRCDPTAIWVTCAHPATRELALTDAAETRRVVLGYFDAWTHNKPDEAFALLADDLVFSGPGATYTRAADFRPGLVAFAGMTRRAAIKQLIVDGAEAAMAYDCELAEPIGTISIASFFRVDKGKIQTYATMFDASKFPKRS